MSHRWENIKQMSHRQEDIKQMSNGQENRKQMSDRVGDILYNRCHTD